MSEVKVNEYKTPATKAKRKNPILRTPQMNLPPSSRSRVSHGLTAAAALGLFELQTCRECGTVQYPPREGCGNCLSSRLFWKVQSGAGELLSTTNLEHSNDLYFKERLPWRLGFIKLDVGPSVVAFLTDAVGDAPTKVNLNLRLDRAGQAVFVADPAPYESGKDMNPNDKLVQETGCDPRGRKILVTDGKTPLGQSLVKSLLAAGADTVWVGHAEPWKKYPGFVELSKVPGVALVKLDLTDVKSVDEIAGEIGGKGRYRHQQRRSTSCAQHLVPARHRCRHGRDGDQLFRPASPGAGVRSFAERSRSRWLDSRGSVGERAVGFCAVEFSCTGDILGIESRCAFTRSMSSSRDDAFRHSRVERVPGPGR